MIHALHRFFLAPALLLALWGCESGDGRLAPASAAAPEAVGASASASADSAELPKTGFASRVERPDTIRALYVNGWAAGSRSRMRELIRIAEETEINAFVIDVKESDTYLVYDSTAIPLAREIGADQRPASRWLPALLDTLQAHGIYSIARIVVFKDRMLAEARPELAIRNLNGQIWLDSDGRPWVNPYDRRVWDYNIAIAAEALDMGFGEIQWDYVRFPDVTAAQRTNMVYPGAGEVSREDNIRDFIAYSREKLSRYQVPIAADVFGMVTYMEGDVGIGQNWEKLVRVSDALLPMVYPSHYYQGMYGFQAPNAHPYEVVRAALQDAVERTEALRQQGEKTAEIIPWLQAMSADWLDDLRYGPHHLRAQIQAVYDSGLASWALWNPGSKYDLFLPALRPADGSPSPLERSGWVAPEWQPPRHVLSPLLRRRDAAAAAPTAAPPDTVP
ncbi:MAG TPA: putative glycoside hydrolase [Longimicrobiaceae bacterium]